MLDMENTEKKTYGLLIPKKSKKTLVSTCNVFGDDNEDSPPARKLTGLPLLRETNLKVKRDTQIEIDKALAEDPNIYDYDGVYDSLKADKEKAGQKTAKKDDKAPKYIQHLMKAAEARKRNQEKLTERKVQKEREQEGDEFDDKEVFVTGAYRQKMQDMQELEKEEKRQAELEAKMDVTKQTDLSGFYRHLLDQTSSPVPVVKEEKEEDPKRSLDIKTETGGHHETLDDTSKGKNTENFGQPKIMSNKQHVDEESKGRNDKANQDTEKKSNNKYDSPHESSSEVPSVDSKNKTSETKKYMVENSHDQRKPNRKEKKRHSNSSSASYSSDSESDVAKPRYKKSDRHSKYQHERRQNSSSSSTGSSSESTSDSDSRRHSKERRKSTPPHSKYDAKQQNESHKVDVSSSKSRQNEHSSSRPSKEEANEEKSGNYKVKSDRDIRDSTFPTDRETTYSNKAAPQPKSESSGSRNTHTTKERISTEKGKLKRETEMKCDKTVTNKYARRTSEEEINEAKARYLARKLANRR